MQHAVSDKAAIGLGECALSQSAIVHQPYWWEAAPPRTPALSPVQDSSDVVVVGAGYTGLSAALTLARAGRSVQVFDRQRLGEGASSRNGGIVSGNLRTSFTGAIKAHGLDRAKAMFLEGKRAREDLKRFIEEEGIDCDFQMSGRFTGFLNPADQDTIGREAELLNTHLGIDARIVTPGEQDGEIGSALYMGGMLRPDIGVIHPAKLQAGIESRAVSAGAVLHGECAVQKIERTGDSYRIETARGVVHAGDVIVATNGYTDTFAPWLRRRIIPALSCMIATETLSSNQMRNLMPSGRAYGEQRRLYRYYRPSPDGTRVLIGTRAPAFTSDPDRAKEHVYRSLIEIFPELEGVALTHSWSGNVAFSLDQLPRLFTHDGIHYACAYCGSGTVWARWLGNKAAYRILGMPEAESMFSCDPPRAVPFYSGKPWFMPLAVAWYGMQDRARMKGKKT